MLSLGGVRLAPQVLPIAVTVSTPAKDARGFEVERLSRAWAW